MKQPQQPATAAAKGEQPSKEQQPQQLQSKELPPSAPAATPPASSDNGQKTDKPEPVSSKKPIVPRPEFVTNLSTDSFDYAPVTSRIEVKPPSLLVRMEEDLRSEYQKYKQYYRPPSEVFSDDEDAEPQTAAEIINESAAEGAAQQPDSPRASLEVQRTPTVVKKESGDKEPVSPKPAQKSRSATASKV
jgi:hypothetical protein